MFKNIIITCFLALTAVILGAFGAHVLKESLTSEQLLSFETAVRYQMYHAIVLLFVNTYNGFSVKQKNGITILFLAGVVCFSGSIYIVQLTKLTAKTIWFITPLGGLFFVVGWISMIIIFIKKLRNQ